MPFIATYTPGGSAWANDSALPRLKSPSELPNAYGTIAPVRTTVLPGTSRASIAAVSTIVSVPCVTTMRVSSQRRQRGGNASAVVVAHLEAVDHHERLDRHRDTRPPEPEHLGHMTVLEEQTPGDLVVPLVERPAAHQDANHR